jgi:hypothetical protein
MRRLGQKQCPQCQKWIKGTRSRVCPDCSYEFQPKAVEAPAAPEPVVVAATVTTEKSVKTGDGITIDQIKAVGEMVRMVGGFGRFREMLDTIRAVGGLKRLRDLLEAMAVTEQTTVRPLG